MLTIVWGYPVICLSGVLLVAAADMMRDCQDELCFQRRERADRQGSLTPGSRVSLNLFPEADFWLEMGLSDTYRAVFSFRKI